MNNNSNFDHSQMFGGSNVEASDRGLHKFMTTVFAWMFLGLIVTAFSALGYIFMLQTNYTVFTIGTSPIFYLAMIGIEFFLVITISRGINKLSPTVARLLFILYSVATGITLSVICLGYSLNVVFIAFIMAATFFAVMCFFGFFTKSNLASMGKILFAGLIAIILCSIVNIFLRSSGFDFIISLAGVAIFTALTAYDVQKLKKVYYGYVSTAGEATVAKVAILGALELYLDLINLFLFILRILGRKK